MKTLEELKAEIEAAIGDLGFEVSAHEGGFANDKGYGKERVLTIHWRNDPRIFNRVVSKRVMRGGKLAWLWGANVPGDAPWRQSWQPALLDHALWMIGRSIYTGDANPAETVLTDDFTTALVVSVLEQRLAAPAHKSGPTQQPPQPA
jgi:hypothetical protein